MKKCALLLNLILVLGFVKASGGMIEVCKTCAISSIKSALEVASAGDEIMVGGGVYEEGGLVIGLPLKLFSKEKAEIKHLGTEGDTIQITAPGVFVEGFRIRGSGKSSFHDFAAIKVINTFDCTIVGNEILDSQYGVLISNTNGCIIKKNTITTSSVPTGLLGDGIHLWKSSRPIIYGNIIQGHRDGIYLEFVDHGQIENNEVSNNHRYGLHFMFSNENIFQGNWFHHNDAGVAVMYSKRIKMIGNTYSHNRGAASFGVLLKDISDSVVTRNIFVNNTVAIFMEGSNRNEFSLNRFERNGWFLRLLSSCEDNRFFNNAFLFNSLEVATNSPASLNLFSENFWAAHMAVDLDQDGFADLPYQPTSYSSFLIEKYSLSVILLQTPLLLALDRLEKYFPALSPVSLRDSKPLLKPPRGLP